MEFKGVLVTGLGEGKQFMSIPKYKEKIKEHLGFDPYPGTLNLKLNGKRDDLLKKFKPLRIDGFKLGIKEFGGLDCYKAKIKNIEGFIVVPDFTKHTDQIEFIAPVYLRSELEIKDGDEIQVELLG